MRFTYKVPVLRPLHRGPFILDIGQMGAGTPLMAMKTWTQLMSVSQSIHNKYMFFFFSWPIVDLEAKKLVLRWVSFDDSGQPSITDLLDYYKGSMS